VFLENSFSCISQKLFKLFGMDAGKINEELCDQDDIFVNWKICSQRKNEQGRLPLYTALEQSVKWSDGLHGILEGNGGAIEEADVITGLEAFMLAAIGRNSEMETVYRLLKNHPAAINPYVRMTQQHISNKKRTHSDI